MKNLTRSLLFAFLFFVLLALPIEARYAKRAKKTTYSVKVYVKQGGLLPKTSPSLVSSSAKVSKTKAKAASRLAVASKDTKASIVPFRKYLTEQGAKNREHVLIWANNDYDEQNVIALDNIFKKEAGYRTDALNEIGAGGLPQAYPASKMGCPLSDEGLRCQYEWAKQYIAQRYGTPSLAWQFHLENNYY